MAVDFDFDTSYNDEEDEDQSNEEFEDYEDEDYEDEGDEEPQKRNPLRLILLVLVILLLLCVVCYLGSQFMSIPIPGLGSAPPPPAPTEAPAEDTSAEGEEDAADAGGAAGVTGGESAEGVVGEGETGEGVAEEDAVGEGEEDEAAAGDAEESAGETDEAGASEEDTAPGEGEADETGDAAGGDAAGEAAESGDEMAGDGEESADAEAGEEEGDEDEEPSIIITTTPVPGPTATPGPGDVGDAGSAAASCDDTNQPPVADPNGPYSAMMGKGQAVVTFDGTGSTETDGTIEIYEWDFGDNSDVDTGAVVRHSYTMSGTYTATLTVIDNCGAADEASVEVTITGSDSSDDSDEGDGDSDDSEGDADDDTSDDESSYEPGPVDPSLGTLGFCHRVQPGDTLSGLALRFGVPLHDLAYVNGVSTEYYVIAGQGLFVPVREVVPQGPNIYQAQPGDTLHSVAYLCGITIADLVHANSLTPDSSLTAGQLVRIPPPWSY